MTKSADAETLPKWLKSHPQWWVYASAGLLILILSLADVGVVLNLRENALRAAEKNLENTSKTLAEEADRAFQAVDIVLTNLTDRLDSAGVTDGPSYERAMSGNDTYLLLKEKLSALPQLDAITMIDPDGKLINFSRYWPIPNVNVADRDYFQALQNNPTATSFIGSPVENRGDGSWTIYLARRVNGSHGQFAGLVLGAMAMKYFEDFYHSVLPGQTSTIAMIRDDSILLARYPPSDAIGQSFSDIGGQRAALNGGTHGTIRESSPIDGTMRIKAAARVSHYPLVIMTTMTEDEALGNWSSVALSLSLITAGCAAAIALAAMAVGRWSRQQRVLARAREEQSAAESARVAAEAELLREREQIAAAANRAKSNFLAMMSHEIRTPMNAVLALTDTLLDDTLDPEKRKIVQTIRESGDTLLRLLNDILDYSKMEAGHISLETLAFAPDALGQNMLSIMGSRAAAKGLFLKYDADADLPAAVLGDAGRIRQVLMNLVSNALKFTQTGGITIATRCVARDSDYASLEWIVTDTGIGISPQKIGALFAEFSQADSSITRRFGGTGLGLAISKRLIDQMGGDISVESAEGRGTTFRVRLKLPLSATPIEVGREHADGEERLAQALARLGRPLRVLVAEDNPTNQFVIAQLLKSFDIRVTLANDGLEAVHAASGGTHDLIFMDMQMPEMDGLEATRTIRKRGGRLTTIPIIALTANAFPEDVEACRNAGMDEFMIKPIKKAQLVDTILRTISAAIPQQAAPQKQEAHSQCALDETALTALSDDLGADTVAEMIGIFLRETRNQLERLAAMKIDAGELLRTIHSLKGAARSACAPGLANLAAEAEARLRREGGTELPERQNLTAALAAYEAAVMTRRLAVSEIM